MNKKKRMTEALKSLAIVALSISALLLAADSQLFGHLPGYQAQREEHGEGAVRVEEDGGRVTLPMAIAVVNSEGCCGMQYSAEQVSALYDQLAPLFGEALVGAGQPVATDPEQWSSCLEHGPGLWVGLQGQMPLSVLTRWVAGTENPVLTGYAEHLLLCVDEEHAVHLYFQDPGDGQYYVCPVEQVSAAYLRNALEQVPVNGARFAGQVQGLEGVQQHLLVSQQLPQPAEYTAVCPLDTDGQARLEMLLEQLAFPVEITTVYDTPEGRRARAGNDTLTISDDGLVSYESTPEEGRYPVDEVVGATPEYWAVESARKLACGLLEHWSGQGGLYLSRVEQVTQDSWRVEFRYELDNIPALVGSRGYAASVLVEQGFITQYELQLRTFTQREGQTTLVLPLRQAAAVMEQLDQPGSCLRLCYQDSGGILRAGWVAE